MEQKKIRKRRWRHGPPNASTINKGATRVSLGFEPAPAAPITLPPGATRTVPRRGKNLMWSRLPRIERDAKFLEHVLAAGWKVQSRGWPKYMCWSPKGEMSVVYVHGAKRWLSKVQAFVAYQLASRGIQVYTWTPSGGFVRVDHHDLRHRYQVEQKIKRVREAELSRRAKLRAAPASSETSSTS